MNIQWRWVMARLILFLCGIAVLSSMVIVLVRNGNTLEKSLEIVVFGCFATPVFLIILFCARWAVENL